jgi:ribosomal protein S18 acetylase RimI-like enzyme
VRERCADKTTAAIWAASATVNSALKGIAFVTVRADAATPFAIIEDLIVKNDARDCGIGSSFIEWIIEEFQGLGLRKVFLESAINNQRAHNLFHRHGFTTLSVVMARDV